MEGRVWKYTVESIVPSTWKQYGNYNMSLFMPKKTDSRDSNTQFYQRYLFFITPSGPYTS